ncbi:HAMP domain-containing protein [Phototrophicus methaneseepsis]|uniref:Oxygen sensor histidine kinase NreB n=1 Tax=Phototrophicus methaneseepsis TaxID=2710758 RepID=A0A7S8ED05_9CHLR|nr:ATP-binding protein [Phototrophicus methaneseepsis]QPC84473.1 HAMP domain-containing protein [Phototrophicus methaneseepsis]
MKQRAIWDKFWAWAGRVPLRQKIIGIIVTPLLILGFTIAWWVSNQLGGWLSYLLSEARVEQAMSVGMRSVSIITVFSAVAGLCIGWFLTWVLTRSILDMTWVARRVENGDLSVRAPVWANDEIGELGRAFNAMITSLQASRQELEQSNDQLKHRNQELAVLYELAHMANQPDNTQQICVRGLQQALENTGAQAGLILVFTEDSPVIAASRGVSEPFLENASASLLHFTFPNSQSLETFEPFILDLDNPPEALPEMLDKMLHEGEQLGYQMFLLMPIAANKNLLGILLLACGHDACISPQNHQLISGICNQLGVTIQNSQLWEKLTQKEQLLTQLLTKVVSAQEEERQRISRELHDETGQALTSLLVQLKILERCNTIEDARASVEDMRQRTARTLQEVRRLAADLRPAALDDLGLISALEGYIYEYANKTGLNVDFQTSHLEDVRLPHDVETLLYRVIQEALTNIARHANAHQVTVHIHQEHNLILATVQDNGCGFNVPDVLNSGERGLGLLGMQERVQLLGGQFKLESQPGNGTQVFIELAVPENVL